MRPERRLIRRGIVLFWATWFGIVFATNLCDVLKAMEILKPEWMFASGNYSLMQTMTERYPTPEYVSKYLTKTLFFGVILWEGLATLLFWQAVFVGRRQRHPLSRAIYQAFACGLALWSAFIIADEVLMAYDLEASHFRLFIAQLVSLLFLELTPDDHEA